MPKAASANASMSASMGACDKGGGGATPTKVGGRRAICVPSSSISMLASEISSSMTICPSLCGIASRTNCWMRASRSPNAIGLCT
jgi:hypothetical protein